MQTTHIHFPTIHSTNTWSKQHAAEFDPRKMTIVTADEQTSGRGRFNRLWVSPAKQNVYATFNFFIEKHRVDIGNIPQVLSLSALKMLEQLGFSPSLKWPNDILISEKKVAGILCETTPLSDLLCVILGIGLNVNMPLESLQEIDRPATSLLVEGKEAMDLTKILEQLTYQFQRDLEVFLDQGFIPFLDFYKKKLFFPMDGKVRFHDNRMIWEGQFHSINHDGSLSLTLASGEIRKFIAGEIL